MSKKANPTLIGMFVLGAVALLVTAVLVIGGGQFFEARERYVTYFEGSVQGLRVGSSVLFKGVRIGYVTEIRLVTDLSDINNIRFLTPVTFETVASAVSVIKDGKPIDESYEPGDSELAGIDALIQQGLRAILEVESLLTGQLLIELDMRPDTAAVFRGEGDELPEIPTIPSNIQETLERAGKLFSDFQQNTDIVGLVNDLHSTINGLDRILNSPDTQALPESARAALDEVAAAAHSTGELIDAADGRIIAALDDIGPVIEQLDKSLQAGEATLTAIKEQLEDDSEISYQINHTLEQIEGAARSLRLFLDYLDQHPEALIKGRQDQ